jgi:molybdate transport system substrate-binding protein
MRSLALTLALVLLAGCAGPGPQAPRAQARPFTVAAAADLTAAFTELGKRYEAKTGQKVTFTFGASGSLAKQIENGAPIDLFASADSAFVDDLKQKGLVLADTVKPYALGHLVLAGSKAAGAAPQSLKDLLDPGVKKIAIANPETAPYGRAAKEALTRAGLWEQLQPKLVFGENIRQTLQFIQTGNAEAGLVAQSVADVPEITARPVDAAFYTPLRQSLAVVKDTPNEQTARTFAAFVTGPEGRPVLQQFGFGLPEAKQP